MGAESCGWVTYSLLSQQRIHHNRLIVRPQRCSECKIPGGASHLTTGSLFSPHPFAGKKKKCIYDSLESTQQINLLHLIIRYQLWGATFVCVFKQRQLDVLQSLFPILSSHISTLLFSTSFCLQLVLFALRKNDLSFYLLFWPRFCN